MPTKTYPPTSDWQDKMHGNISKAVIQLSYRDCTQGKTELIKNAITDLSTKLFNQNITLIISSPIPYPALTNRAFSRAYSINNWLIDFCVDNDIPLIDNFHSLSNSRQLFTHDGYDLTHIGSKMIGKVISETLTALSPKWLPRLPVMKINTAFQS